MRSGRSARTGGEFPPLWIAVRIPLHRMAPNHQPQAHAASAAVQQHNVVHVLGRGALATARVPVLPQLTPLAYLCHRRIAAHVRLDDWVREPAFLPACSASVSLPVWAGVLVWTLAALLVGRRLRGRRKGSLVGRDWEREEFIGMRTGGGVGDDDDEWEGSKGLRGRARRAGLCVFYLSLLLYDLHHCRHYEHPPPKLRFRPALQNALTDPHPEGYARGERIFIAAAFHQNEDVLPYWSKSMLDAITYLGPDNVFVSVVENYSSDRSPTSSAPSSLTSTAVGSTAASLSRT